MVRKVALTAVLGLLALFEPVTARADCAARLLPATNHKAGSGIDGKDLIELLDFGSVDAGGSAQAPFSLSPDGAWLAVAVRRADVSENAYCVGILLVAVRGNEAARLIDTGGEFIAGSNDVRGVPNIVNGSPNPGTPSWSADGKWVVYRRRDNGITQIWRAGINGGAVALTRLPTDATEFQWNPDGKTITILYRPGMNPAVSPSEQRRLGYHYDAHFWSLSEAQPRPALPLAITALRVNVASGATLGDGISFSKVSNDAEMEVSGDRWRAYAKMPSPASFFGTKRLSVERRGAVLPCSAEICGSNISGLWRVGSDLFFRRDGTPKNGGRLRFYIWSVGSAKRPGLVLETSDAIFGCMPTPRSLLCARETATKPRTIIQIEPRSGAISTLFDPNPGFAKLTLGSVRRIVWTDRDGISSYGDLVLPPTHRDGQRHPMIVVQYLSRGFLRGGTGDEYPIQLLAAHGFAVLSFQKPEPLPAAARAADIDAVQRVNIAGWAERRMILGSLEAGVDAAIATGTVDPDKIGITGLSDGASTTQFAILNSDRFKAAAMSTCCDEPSGLFTAGTAYGDALLRWGYPANGALDGRFWRPMSLAENASSVRTPLLIQASDNEYRLALQSFAALRQAGAPVDMYVFANEYHLKIEPAHRLAVYMRGLAWFDFWLAGIDHPPTASLDEIARWTAMRDLVRASQIISRPHSYPGFNVDQAEYSRAGLAIQ